MQITRGVIKSAQKILIYGPEGIGKSTLASKFPNPVFIDTEGSTKHMNVARLPDPSSWTMLLEAVKYIKQNPSVCDTLVIDTADWAERLCNEFLCDRDKKDGLEGWGYGKGYTYLAEEFGRFLDNLTELIRLNINTVITAHAFMRKFEQPDELGAYDRWELKLQRKTAPIVKEWADMVLFANYKTLVVNVDNQGAAKGKNKPQGGKRVMFTTHHLCWDAKNRHNLPEELPLDYGVIAHCIIPRDELEGKQVKTLKPEPQAEPNTEPEFTEEDVPFKDEEKEKKSETYVRAEAPPMPDNISKALLDLMQQNEVTVEEIQEAVSGKGYYPSDTPIENYDPDFINGVLVGAWNQVYGIIKENRKDTAPY